MVAGKPWSEERKAAFAAKREGAKAAAPAAKSRGRRKDANAEAIEQIYGVGSVILMTLGRVNESFLADALTLQLQAEETGGAFAEVAKINPRIADMLATSAPATPYILLGTVLMGTGLQIAANHGLKLGPLASQTVPRSALIAEMKGRMAQAQQLAETQAAQAEAELADMKREAELQAEEDRHEQETLKRIHAAEMTEHVAVDGWDPILAEEAVR